MVISWCGGAGRGPGTIWSSKLQNPARLVVQAAGHPGRTGGQFQGRARRPGPDATTVRAVLVPRYDEAARG